MTKLESIAETASHNLNRLIVEASKEIEEAIQKAVVEAQNQEKDAVFRLGFSITLNLDTNKMDCDLSWNVKRKLSVEEEIPNPDQPKLPLEETDNA